MRCFCTKTRTYHCKVVLLDDQELLQEIQEEPVAEKSTGIVKTTNFKFPRVHIPMFEGQAGEWSAFKRLYEAIIHSNADLTDFDKHNYLRSRLRGEPLTLIESLPLEAVHYQSAWEIIVNHYDDPFERVSSYFDAITGCAPMSDKKQTLRGLISHFRANVTALQTIFKEMPDVDPLSQFCIYIFLTKADKLTRVDWERELSRSKEFADFRQFIDFMDARCGALERAGGSSVNKVLASQSRDQKCLTTKVSKEGSPCYYCRVVGHRIYKCDDFNKLTAVDRNSFVRKKRLCSRCLSGRCNGKCRFNCRKCRGPHNTLIHIDNYKQVTSSNMSKCSLKNILHLATVYESDSRLNIMSDDTTVETTNSVITKVDQVFTNEEPFPGWIGSLVDDNIHSLLATAVISVYGTDKSVYVRAVLDSGSQFNLITTKLVKQLHLSTINTPFSISGVGNIQTRSNTCVEIKIKSRVSSFESSLHCLVLDEIVDVLPSRQFEIESWKIPSDLILADDAFNIPQGIDVLLGLNIFWKVLNSEYIMLGKNLPRLQDSKLGWLVTGDFDMKECVRPMHKFFYLSESERLSHILERCWIQEDSNEREPSIEEQECERFFSETTVRDASGRYVVRLPVKIPLENLGQSRPQALKRFYHLERKFERNDKFKGDYIACMNDYLIQGHMREVSEPCDEICYYIPHHAVFKETSSTTKLRVVFDASMETTSGLSLNACLMKGPVVQPDLVSIVLRFRTLKYAFTADITKMYRQIRIHPNDMPLQRILWRKSSSEPIKTYELTTVTFGETPAPFLATRCLKRLAEDEGNSFPLARHALLNDFYVDDVLSGAKSFDEAVKLQSELINMLGSAGFELNKWCSNSSQLLEKIPEAYREVNFSLNNDAFMVKTLGICWLPNDDVFKPFIKKIDISSIITPRQVLSVIASIYDPLGLLGPVLVLARIFMQRLWTLVHEVDMSGTKTGKKRIVKGKMNWDSSLRAEDKREWLNFISNLEELNKISIPRYLLLDEEASIIEIHGFADASKTAYGAAVYLRSITNTQSCVKLICSKSRVAPLKQQSLPRLELSAAVILAELVEKVKRFLQHNLKINIIRLWSDSEIVLYWIHAPSRRWQTYVANRVQRVQSASKNCVWDHVNSATNPADLISRGVKPEQLRDCKLWWMGPDWLLDNLDPFNDERKFSFKQSYQLELKRPACLFASPVIIKSDIFNRYSNYTRLLRITAWLQRFIWNFHWFGPYIYGPLQVFELDQAFFTLIKLAQRETFAQEFQALEAGTQVGKGSPLKSLSPFLDARGAIRVGGRLQNSNLSYMQQHQYVLSSNHPFAKLIVQYEHERHFHAGPQLMRSVLRRRYWIIYQNKAINNCIQQCKRCILEMAKTPTQEMAPLPRDRVIPNKPFHISGVDYAGPFNIVGKGGRHKVMVTAYISIFVCFTTKAIHLELVSDLTSACFLAALERFTGRRGTPLKIYSDNGKTFVGANSSIQNIKSFFHDNSEIIINSMALKGCQWTFIPPYSPNFGGLWEAGVKSVKAHLRSILAESSLNFEQLNTCLIQVEACLNSRPLTPESNNPNDINALTPGHFLAHGPITALPAKDLTGVPTNRLKHWDRVKKLSQIFWKRWNVEYLNTLQQRNKWRERNYELKIGDMVVIKDKNTMPTTWPLARIVELYRGKDGLVRIAKLRTAKGMIERSLSRLVLIPTQGELSTSTGQDVLDTVFRHLNLIETSYFGLRYVDCNNQTHWLDTTKKITKQLKGKDSFTLYFGVKFYAADPCKLVEEITRYQFFLQVKQDILQGRLPVSFDLLAELGAYAVQSELGDYDPRRHSPGYVSEFRFISNQTVELENKIAELHKGLQGQLPAVAELNYLDKVKWLEMYGVDLHPVIGEDNVEYFLGLTPVGVIVLRNKSKVANYYWSRIKKIYFKGKYFMLRVSDKNNEENTYGFETPSRAACKHLYKCCKEHHSFFQLVHVSTNAPDVINTRFSSSRVDKLSGRSSQMGMRNPPSFIRTPSRRYQRRIVEGAAETPKIEEKMPVKENPTNDESKSVYVASSTTNSFYINRSDSPRSTRSAPWSVWGSTGPPRNSYSSHSPRSVRSAGPQVRLTHAKRSSSVESQSSNDSRPCRRHKHKSKRGSDNESDLSRCSSHGHSHRRHRHRSRRSSGSEQEHHSHHGSHTRYKLIDSEGQWKEVQRRQAEGNSGIQEATVVRPRSGYVNSGIETESEHSSCHHHRRKHRKHRSRSRSPEGSKSHLPDELKKHLEFQLVDTEGMSEDQLREIPYTVVKTNASKAVRVRLSSSGKPKVHSIRRTKNDVIKENVSGCNEDSPPPPYSESPILSDLSSKTTSTSTTAGTGTSDGSKQISAAHLTRVSSHMMRSNGNNVNPKTACSALYGNPSNLLGHPHYNMAASNSNKDVPNGNNSWMSNNSNFPVNSLVVGLPPQPHSRRPYSNSHSDLSLNTSTRSLNSQKGWPSPEIRGAVGIPWSPLAEQIQSPSVNSLYSTLENTRRAPILSADYNNINQNILEHRSINGNAFRSNTKASPQVSTSNVNQNAKMAAENEKVRKHHTPAETGVLRSYTNTPNGKMAWPNERQLGWQPKSNEKNASNLNHNWSGNGNWNNDDYSQQWNNAGTPMVGNAVPQSWQIPQQLPQPPVNFRGVDRGPLLFAPQSQMHRINENVSAEAAESKNFINFVNNNQSNSPNSPNNNMSTQHSITSDVNGRICSQINTERNTENCTRSNENLDTTCNTNNINDSNNNDRNPNNQDSIKQFIQEMSTEL